MSEFEVIASVGTMRDYLGTLMSIVDEAVLSFREGELYAEAREPANVAMVNQTLDAAAFEHYHSEGFKIGVNLERFDDFLAHGNSDDLVNLELDAETRRIQIDLPESDSAPATDFSMAGIDPDSIRDAQNITEVEGLREGNENLVIDVTLDAAALTHGIDVVGMVSDHMEIDADPDRDDPFHIYGEGDTDDARVEYGDSLHEGSTVDAEAMSLFSHGYLDELTDPMPKDAAVRLRTGDEWPIRFDFEWCDGHGETIMMCAPRIQSR